MPKLTGREELALPPDRVWALLNDPAALGSAIPGCGGFERRGDGLFDTTLSLVIGPVRGVWSGTVEYRDVEPPTSCTIVIRGSGDKGSIEGQGALTLAAREDRTEVAYEGTFRLTGPVAGVGARLAPGISRRMIVETLRNLESAATVPDDMDVKAAPPGPPTTRAETGAAPRGPDILKPSRDPGTDTRTPASPPAPRRFKVTLPRAITGGLGSVLVIYMIVRVRRRRRG